MSKKITIAQLPAVVSACALKGMNIDTFPLHMISEGYEIPTGKDSVTYWQNQYKTLRVQIAGSIKEARAKLNTALVQKLERLQSMTKLAEKAKGRSGSSTKQAKLDTWLSLVDADCAKHDELELLKMENAPDENVVLETVAA